MVSKAATHYNEQNNSASWDGHAFRWIPTFRALCSHASENKRLNNCPQFRNSCSKQRSSSLPGEPQPAVATDNIHHSMSCNRAVALQTPCGTKDNSILSIRHSSWTYIIDSLPLCMCQLVGCLRFSVYFAADVNTHPKHLGRAEYWGFGRAVSYGLNFAPASRTISCMQTALGLLMPEHSTLV